MRDGRIISDEASWPDLPHDVPDRTLVVMVDLATVAADPEVLDTDERARAARLRTAELRHDFIAAHVAVRQLLAWFVSGVPAALGFDIDAHGKPHLRDHDVRFSLSHSGGHALVAIGRTAHLGVDLEIRDRLHDADRLAPRVLASAELAAYLALPDAVRADALLRTWTRKEAVLKAIGLGLPGGMEHVVLDDAQCLIGDFAALPALSGLTVHDLPVGPGFVAAVALDRTAAAPLPLRWRAPRSVT